jgi:hypothetical protein
MGSAHGGGRMNMPDAPEDNLGVRLLQMIQTVQQDQLKLLEMINRVIQGMEQLEQRVQKVEEGPKHANEQDEPSPFEDAPKG